MAAFSIDVASVITNFVSDDRYQASADGSVRKIRWSTPLLAYRSFGPVRLAAGGEARWHEPDGEYAYIELTLDEVRYNLGR